MRVAKIITFIVAWLVISMPLATADALASINSVIVKGSAGVDGFRKASSDNIVVEADITATEQLTNDKVYIAPVGAGISEYEKFSSCAVIGSGRYKCTYTDDSDFEAGRQDFEVLEFATSSVNELTLPVSKAASSIVSDEAAPVITILEAPKQNGDNLTIKYTISDSACNDGKCPNVCSGIGRIEVPEAGVSVLINVSACVYENKELSVYLPGTGERALTLVGYDRAGNSESYSTGSFMNDHDAPVIHDRYTLLRAGLPIEMISTTSANRGMSGVDLRLDIDDANLSYVAADLSELNGNSVVNDYSHLVLDVRKDCTNVGSTFTCTWKNLNVILFGEDVPIDVEVRDASGNYANNTIVAQFTMDNVRPEVTLIGTEGCIENKCYISKGVNTIIVRMTESGAGFNTPYSLFGRTGIGKRVIMNLNSIAGGMGADYSAVFANECNQTAPEEWTCYWYNVRLNPAYASRDEFDVYILPESRDDAMNPVAGIMTTRLVLNKNPPVLKKFEISSVRETEGINGTLSGGRPVTAGAVLKSTVPIKAIGDFSKIVPDAKAVVGACEFNQDTSEATCLWSDLGAAKSVTENAPLPNQEVVLKFIDYSGNMLVYKPRVDLLFEKNAPANYWYIDSSQMDVTPKSMDKGLVHLINHRVFAKAPLSKTGVSNVKPVKISIDSCTSDMVTAKSVTLAANDYAWFNFMLQKKAVTDTVSFNCVIRIVSNVQNRFVSSPELENISVSVRVVDTGFLMDEEINKKIESARDDVLYKLSSNGVFKTLDKIMQIGEKICNIIKLVNSIAGVFSAAIQILDALRFFPGGHIAANNAQKAADIQRGAGTRLFHLNDKFCQYLSCQTGAGPSGALAKDFYNKVAGDTKVIKGGRLFKGMTISPPTDAKDSFVLSLMSMCIPGIIYNLKKYRKIQCDYITCMKARVATGVPIITCDLAKGFATCKYWWGEAFSFLGFLFPGLNFIKSLGSYFDTILSHPVEFVLAKFINCEAQRAARLVSGVPKDIATRASNSPLDSPIQQVNQRVKEAQDTINKAPIKPGTGTIMNKIFYMMCTLSETMKEVDNVKAMMKEMKNTKNWKIDDSTCDGI